MLFLATPFVKESANIPKSVTGTHIWEILSKELRFESSVEKIDESAVDNLKEKEVYFLKFPQEEYDSIAFYKKLNISMKGFRRNVVQRIYDRHTAVFGILGIIAASGATVAAILTLLRQ